MGAFYRNRPPPPPLRRRNAIQLEKLWDGSDKKLCVAEETLRFRFLGRRGLVARESYVSFGVPL